MPDLSKVRLDSVSNTAGTFACLKWDGEIVGLGELLRRLAQPDRASRLASFFVSRAQGGRGRGRNTTTFQRDRDKEGDKGVWMSVRVEDVEEMHKHCVATGLEVIFPPTDMPRNVRKMHLRHPDGHVFRIGEVVSNSQLGSLIEI